MAVRITSQAQSYTRTLSLGTVTQFTVCGWFKIGTDRNQYSTLWDIGADDDDAHVLQTDTNGSVLAFYDGDTSKALTGGSLTAGVWYFVGVSVNGSSSTVLIRSASATSSSVTSLTGGSSSLALTTLRIGQSHFDTTEYLNGCVAAFKLWTGASLSQAEMENEAWTTLPHRTAGLRSWHPFTRAETTDYSGLGNTLSGGTSAATEDGPPVAWRRGRTRVFLPLNVDADAAPDSIDAAWSLPGPDVALSLNLDLPPLDVSWLVPTPDVSTTPGPPTFAQPDAIHAQWSVTAPDLRVSVTYAPAPIVAAWSLPPPAIVVPVNPGDDIGGPSQVSFAGFKLGDGTPYLVQKVTGWYVDMPSIDNGNVLNPSSHGATSGRKLSQARVVNLEVKVRADHDSIDDLALDLLSGLPLPDSDEELDLAISIGAMILVGRGAVVDRKLAVDRTLRDGYIPGQVVWELSDPRLYMRGLNSATISDGGIVEVANVGNTNTRPIVRCDGPATKPRFEVTRTLGDGTMDARVVEFNITVGEGERFVVDVARGTATIGEASQMRYLTGASIGVPDWVLGRGANEISYETTSGGAPAAVVLWQHALL